LGNITIIKGLPQGSTVGLSDDRSCLEVKTPENTTYHSHSPLRELPKPPKNARFSKVFGIPADKNELFLLIKGEMSFGDHFDVRSLRLIEQGAAYSTVVDLGDSPEIQAANYEALCTFHVVLQRDSKGCVLLGMLTRRLKDFKKNEGVCAILDLLGFTSILEAMPVDELETKYTQTLMSILGFARFSSIGAFVIDDDGNVDAGEDLARVSYSIFSDTVILYPKERIERPVRTLCETTAILLDMSFDLDWAFRGAIDVGTFRAVSDHNLFLGTSVVRAHKAELSQNWSGCIVASELRSSFPEEIDTMLRDHLLVEYAVPIKTAVQPLRVAHEKRLAVNWTYFAMGERRDDQRERKLKELLAAAPDVAKSKLQETLTFQQVMRRLRYSSIGNPLGRVIGDPTKLK
jgi:hypothetical protein